MAGQDSASANVPTTPAPSMEIDRELRCAVVMYGGISLAIYMNGVAQELLHFVRATAPGPLGTHALIADADLSPTEKVYRDLARLTADGKASSSIRQRFVIDILSGTSAGGINAVFLAKALVNNQSLDSLAELWELEADLETLINDRKSVTGERDLVKPVAPRSALNGQRMYVKLCQAFKGMKPNGTVANATLADEIDLFVTTTDLRGLPVRLMLGGGEIAEERKHRKMFHLRRDDFSDADVPFLAFISRCTSSLPVAFEPAQLKALNLKPADLKRWDNKFHEYDEAREAGNGVSANDALVFGDGGYLDNKPFGYAIEAITQSHGGAAGRVDRKLIYVDPDPERLASGFRGAELALHVPGPAENALLALGLPRYETIREDLLRLRDRNRVIAKIESVVLGIDDDFEALDNGVRGQLALKITNRKGFGRRNLQDIVSVFGAAYGGYHRLKVAQMTDELAEAIARRMGTATDSDEFKALRLLVGAWRRKNFVVNPDHMDGPKDLEKPTDPKVAPQMTSTGPGSEFTFLELCDLTYRVRRLSFVLERINQLREEPPAEMVKTLGLQKKAFGADALPWSSVSSEPSALAIQLDSVRSKLGLVLRTLRQSRDVLLGRASAPAAEGQNSALSIAAEEVKVIREAVSKIMLPATHDERVAKARKLIDDGPTAMNLLTKFVDGFKEQVDKARDQARKDALKAMGTNDPHPSAKPPHWTDATQLANHIARHYYSWYELYDSMIFPIQHGAGVGEELAYVEPVRISPLRVNAKTHEVEPDERLQPSGLQAGHFGAFFDKDWRGRDILIGRLNAARKLIATAGHGSATDLETLVLRAQRAVVEEEYGRPDSYLNRQLRARKDLSTTELRCDYVLKTGLPAKELPRERLVSWLARVSRVLGRVFDGAAADSGPQKTAAGWLLKGGQVVALLSEIAVPRRWWSSSLRRLLIMVLVAGLVLVVAGVMMRRDQVWTLGLSVVAVSALAFAVAYPLRLWMLRRTSGPVSVLKRLISLVVIVIVAAGVYQVYQLLREYVLPWFDAHWPPW